jgi:Ca2+-binding RTX toxin-like protein
MPPVNPTPNGQIDGDGTDLLMQVGFVDSDGDVLTDGDDTIFAYSGNNTIEAGDGNDLVFGGDGRDLIFGQGGNDTIFGGAGDDWLFGGDGDDKLVGEEGNDLIVGDGGNNLMYGDGVFGDNGGLSPDDAPEPGFGNDTLVSGTGNDTMFGGSGDDVFIIPEGFGNHVITGGETGETEGDTVDASGVTSDMTVVYTGDEAGTFTTGQSTASFTEIERLELGSGDDDVTVLTSTTGFVNGNDGFDTLILPPADDPNAPLVDITSRVDNGDGTTTFAGTATFPDGSVLTFKNFEEIICFAAGTLIDTAEGPRTVESLEAGDRVLTRDHGYQPLVWTGARSLDADDLAACPAVQPVRIAAGALGAGLPQRDLLVSPRHRMLVTGAKAELMFGAREVLVTAADLLGQPGIRQEVAEGVTYVHIMCARHEILRAEGAWSESFQPAAAVLPSLNARTRDELLALFPELAKGTAFPAARPTLNRSEALALLVA